MKTDKIQGGALAQQLGAVAHQVVAPDLLLPTLSSATLGEGIPTFSATTAPITANCSRVSAQLLTFAPRSSITVRFPPNVAAP